MKPGTCEAGKTGTVQIQSSAINLEALVSHEFDAVRESFIAKFEQGHEMAQRLRYIIVVFSSLIWLAACAIAFQTRHIPERWDSGGYHAIHIINSSRIDSRRRSVPVK